MGSSYRKSNIYLPPAWEFLLFETKFKQKVTYSGEILETYNQND